MKSGTAALARIWPRLSDCHLRERLAGAFKGFIGENSQFERADCVREERHTRPRFFARFS